MDSGSTNAIDDLLDWFVPVYEDRETERRAWRVAGSTIFLILVCLVFVTLDLFRKVPLALPLALMMAAAFGGVILAVLKKIRAPRLAGHMLCSGIIAVLAVQCAIDSGFDNPSVVPILLVPWIAAICLGGREACIYAGVGTFFFAGFYALSAQEYDFIFSASRAHIRIFLLVMCFIMIWTVAGIGYTYEQYRRNAWAAKEQLASQNGRGFQPEVFSALTSDMRPFVLDIVGLAAAVASDASPSENNLTSLTTIDDLGGATATKGLRKRHAPLIQENGYQLLAILNTADELAELERKRNSPLPTHVSVPEDIEEALLPLHELADSRGLGLWIEEPDLEMRSIHTDLLLLKHLLNLLVQSSLERLRSGHVTVSFTSKGGELVINVGASGPRKNLSLSQNTYEEASLGSHLSLATASRLADKIRGRLDISSRSPEMLNCTLTLANMPK